MEIHSFFRLVRWRNLFLVIVLQGLVSVRLYHACNASSGGCSLDLAGILLIILITLLVTAAGYVVNDIYDVEIDRVNRPDKMIVGNLISRKTGWFIYGAMVLAGGIAALGLNIEFNDPVYLAGYILATALLFSYSLWWKKSFLAGNLLVSFMCGVAVFVFLIPDWGSQVLQSGTPSLLHVMLALMWFAATMTLYREIVKDMEDMQGDSVAAARTLPIRLGYAKARIIGTFVGITVVISLALWFFVTWQNAHFLLNAGVVSISFMMAHTILLLGRAGKPKELHVVSQYIKVIMLIGIIVFLIY